MNFLPMPKNLRACIAFTLAALFINQLAPVFAQSPQSLTVREIMSEPSMAGMRAEGEKLAPNGKQAAYLWSATGREPRDLYVISTHGGEKPKLLARAVDEPAESRPDVTKSQDEARTTERKEERVMQRDAAQQARASDVSGIEWSPDSRRLLFSKSGDLYVVTDDSASSVRRLTRTDAKERDARWLADSHRILYQSDENLFVIDADQSGVIQLTRETSAAAEKKSGGAASQSTGSVQAASSSLSVSAAQASDDGTRVAYISSDTSKQRALIVPDYRGEYVTAPTVRRGWTEQRLEVVNSDGTSRLAVQIKLPPPEGASYIRGFRWMPDHASLLIDRIDRDTKRRQIFLASATDGTSRLIDEERDAKWVAPLSRIVEPSPKGDRILFASERDGFNHLYLAPLDRNSNAETHAMSSTAVQQLTRGAWEVGWAKWMPDGETIIYSSTEESTAERHFHVLNTRNDKILRLPTGSGMNVDPQLSKDGEVLLYEHSEWNVPGDLYSLRVCTGCRVIPMPAQLTDTVPQRFKQISWTRPQFIEYSTKDGKSVKARIYTPPRFDRSSKYPAVVFVHGAGYLQNVINGWSYYWREGMFHTLLTMRGYVVLDVDYRGSAGYGRDWRTDVYDFLGGLDLQDHLDGIDTIVKNYAVDPARVGMYGGSYGGFMAEMAAMRAPATVACAAALRPVADWKNYYASSPVYTTERLGFPDKNPEAYRRSSPITYADQLRRPLLILHGMVDDNVHFQDSVQLVEKLIELGKSDYFEVMFYPAENHSFIRPESWADEYERILRFFDEHLQGKTRSGQGGR